MSVEGAGASCSVFVSHSSEDRKMAEGKPMRSFVEKLRELVCAKAKLDDAERALFFDESSIRMADEWNDVLADAVRTSQSLVCLVSPRFLASQWCGREVEVFHRRHEASKLDGENAAGLIFPLIWEVDPKRRKLPEKLAKFQYREAGMPKDYEELGVRQLIALRKHGQVQKVAEVVSTRIAEKLGEPGGLPEEPPFADFQIIPNAFLDAPLPYDVVLLPAVKNGPKWQPTSAQEPLSATVEKAVSAMRTCLHLLPSPADEAAFERLNGERQILLVVADADEAPTNQALLKTLNAVSVANVALVLVDTTKVPGGQPRSVVEWVDQMPDGAFQKAIREQRAVACFVDQLQREIERAITRVKLALLESDPGAKVVDATISAEAASQGIPIETAPLLFGSGREVR